ncbi:MAG: helix-turn-helix transcriptional regulator [Eubacteriales bacterium]|nr:helix-turn-helix transcriptional regulator [Eubacteriales bacterium]
MQAKKQVTRLRKERIRREWTLLEVGEKVGVTKQTIQRIETLKCNPSYEVLVKLQHLFGLYRCDLLEQVDADDAPFSSTN